MDVVAAGSNESAVWWLRSDDAPPASGVVVIMLAAAFTDASRATLALSQPLLSEGVTAEILLMGTRADADNPSFAQRVAEADVALVAEGSALHLRTTIRRTALDAALRHVPIVLAVGSSAGVLGATMIDPRGGAPTTGAGFFDDVVLAVPSPTLARSYELVDVPMLVVHPTGVVRRSGTSWRRVHGEVTASRASANVTL